MKRSATGQGLRPQYDKGESPQEEKGKVMKLGQDEGKVEDDSMFHELRKWIESHKGWIHDSIGWRDDLRVLYVAGSLPTPGGQVDDADAAIASDEIVMRIPYQALVSSSCRLDIDRYQEIVEHLVSEKDSFHHPLQDVLLSWILASHPKEKQPYLDSLPRHDGSDVNSMNELPRQWSDKDLGWLRGSPLLARIECRRIGLRQDHDKLKQQIIEQGNKSKQVASKDDSSCTSRALPSPCVPTLEAFDHAMAMVSSRAFEFNGENQEYDADENDKVGGKMYSHVRQGDTVLIPLLDLCNHNRGRGGSTATPKKNLSYAFDDGEVLVRAYTPLQVGDVLTITYGAKANAQLLLNYGFCLPPASNMEPDGSSNDFLEFQLRSTPHAPTPGQDAAQRDHGGLILYLRTGPKSYTYGNFVKCIEHFYDLSNTSDQSTGETPSEKNKNPSSGVDGATSTTDGFDGVDDDMNAFLDDCDAEDGDMEEEEDHDEGYDWTQPTDNLVSDQVASGGKGYSATQLQQELKAIAAFAAELKDTSNMYAFEKDDLEMTLAGPATGAPKYYAAMLVKSELRIIYFFLLALQCLDKKLRGQQGTSHDTGRTEETEPIVVEPFVALKPEDEALFNEQVEELVEAYFAIRHSHIAF